MHKIKISNLLIILLISTFGLSTLANADDSRVKFAIGEWQPYTGEDIANYGMATEIVTAALSAVGLKPEYRFFPWRRAEAVVGDGEFFGTFPYKETPERVGKFYFSDVLFKSSFGILIHKDNQSVSGFTYKKINDFENYSVGILAGTDAVSLPLKAAGVKIEEVKNANQNIKKLLNGRVDFIIDDRAVLYQSLQEVFANNHEKINDFKFLKKGFGEENVFGIMVSTRYPNSQEIMEKINSGLMNIRENGEYQKILTKYGFSE